MQCRKTRIVQFITKPSLIISDQRIFPMDFRYPRKTTIVTYQSVGTFKFTSVYWIPSAVVYHHVPEH